MNLPCPFRIYPVGQSPGPSRFGSFSHGTVLLLDFALLSFWIFPSSLVCRLPQPTLGCRLPAVQRLSPSFFGTIRQSDHSPCFAPRFAFDLSGPLCRCLCDNTASSPGVMLNSSGSCRPHTPCCDGLNEFAFVPIVRTRPSPIFGRPVHPRFPS